MSASIDGAQVLTVLFEGRLATLTRVLGLLRRRNFPVRTVTVEPMEPAAAGLSKLTVTLAADRATADRAVLHVENVMGVHEVITYPATVGPQENRS